MDRPCNADIEEAVACLKDNGLDRVALWLERECGRVAIRAAARRMGVTVRYYRRNVLKPAVSCIEVRDGLPMERNKQE